MKILYSCISKSWGGMEMLTLTQMQQLLNRKITVELLCLKGSRMYTEAEARGFITHTVKSSAYLNSAGIAKIISVTWDRTDSRDKNKFELVHTHSTRDLWLLVPALKISRSSIPLVLTKHIGSFIVKKDFLHRWLYGRVTKAVAISSVIKKNLVQTTPLPEHKVLLVYNGIDTEKFDPAKASRKKIRGEFKIADDEILIGMVGRFSPGKGHEEFLTAAKILNEKKHLTARSHRTAGHNDINRLKFIITGEASYGEKDYENQVRKISEDLGLKNIIFTGYRSDTKDILSAMDIFIFPSHAESFGLALAEAMAMELPSVSSDSGGVLDIVIDNETGLLFENKNPQDLAEKVYELIAEPALRKKLGKAARQRVIENFNIEKQTDKIIEIYESLIKNQ